MTMIIDRPTYKDASVQEARSRGYDIIQLKYDGWWDRIEIANGYIRHYSQTGRMFKEQVITNQDLHCTLIGEHMQGTQWSQEPGRLGKTFIFDAWMWQGTDLRSIPYFDRYRVCRLAPTLLPETFELVACQRISDYELMWAEWVEHGDFEGIVFKKGTDDINGTLLRHKKTISETYTALAFIEGVGKFYNTLGAIVIGDSNGLPLFTEGGEPATVSGGTMTDEQRKEVWDNQPLYLNKPFEAEGKARFKSGLLRHPNFSRWRNDR